MQTYFPQIEKPLRVARIIMREIEGKEVEASRLKGKKNHPTTQTGDFRREPVLVGSATPVAINQISLEKEHSWPIV
ncbi:hypothetical protein [Pseudomonas silesiensis]|uniref:hypothetical protein n=1 Tax=Pseudomonas silesiensis TaxID=1853130 RepID=UPI0030DABB31